MLRYFLLWALALAGLCNGVCEAGVLTPGQEQYRLQAPDVAILRDPTGTLAVEQLAQPQLAAQFVRPEHMPLLGYTRDVIWLRLTLQRRADAPSHWYLEVTNPFINDLRLYTQAANGFRVSQAGDQFAFAQREVPFHHPVFALVFPDERPQTFYLRMDSDSSLSAQLLVWQPAALQAGGQQDILLFGAVLGMLSMSFLISVIHWTNSRETKLLQFAVLTASAVLLVATGLGLVAQFFTPTQPWIADLLVPGALALTTASFGIVFSNALDLRADFPRLDRFVRYAAVLALCLPFTRALDLYSAIGGPLLQSLLLGNFFISGWVSWVRWRMKVQSAGYFFAAHAILIGSMLAGRLMLLGLLPANALTYWSWVPGLLTFTFLVHAGIFVDSRSGRRARDAARNEVRISNEVLQSERSLRDEQTVFFSFVAHELRSPLAAILTGVKNLENELVNVPPPVVARIKRMKGSAERMGGLIDRHLNLQRLASADFAPQFLPTDPRHSADEVLRRVRTVLAERHFAHAPAVSLVDVVMLDEELLLMALENLLLNAAKFSPNKDAVLLEVFSDTALHYRVSDRGPGIADVQQSALFSVFKRSQHTPLQDGFGIGLAIVQHVARVHGGALAYAHRAGGGAVFTLTLPLSR